MNELLLIELDQLLTKIKGRTPDQIELTQLYNIHNSLLPHTPEHNKGCGSCRTRVMNRLYELNTINKN